MMVMLMLNSLVNGLSFLLLLSSLINMLVPGAATTDSFFTSSDLPKNADFFQALLQQVSEVAIQVATQNGFDVSKLLSFKEQIFFVNYLSHQGNLALMELLVSSKS